LSYAGVIGKGSGTLFGKGIGGRCGPRPVEPRF